MYISPMVRPKGKERGILEGYKDMEKYLPTPLEQQKQ